MSINTSYIEYCRNNRLSLSSLFKTIGPQWKNAHEEYMNSTGGDLSYAYNERVNISFLAAAAWKAGLVCLEEFATVKQAKRDRRSKRRGRGDLYISSGKDHYYFEAKQSWIYLKSKDSVIEKNLKKDILAAQADCKRTKHKDHTYALNFICPYLQKSEKIDNAEKFTRGRFEFILGMAKKFDDTIFTASFTLDEYEKMKIDGVPKTRGLLLWPGCIMVISRAGQ